MKQKTATDPYANGAVVADVANSEDAPTTTPPSPAAATATTTAAAGDAAGSGGFNGEDDDGGTKLRRGKKAAPTYGTKEYWEARYRSHALPQSGEGGGGGKRPPETMEVGGDEDDGPDDDNDDDAAGDEIDDSVLVDGIALTSEASRPGHAWYFTYAELRPLLLPLLLGPLDGSPVEDCDDEEGAEGGSDDGEEWNEDEWEEEEIQEGDAEDGGFEDAEDDEEDDGDEDDDEKEDNEKETDDEEESCVDEAIEAGGEAADESEEDDGAREKSKNGEGRASGDESKNGDKSVAKTNTGVESAPAIDDGANGTPSSGGPATADSIREKRPKRVLEIGCGDVPLGKSLAAELTGMQCDLGCKARLVVDEILCVDYSEVVVDKLKLEQRLEEKLAMEDMDKKRKSKVEKDEGGEEGPNGKRRRLDTEKNSKDVNKPDGEANIKGKQNEDEPRNEDKGPGDGANENRDPDADDDDANDDDAPLRPTYQACDARALPLPSNYYDVVVDKGTLDAALSDPDEGLSNCIRIVSEMARTTCVGGAMMIVSHLNANEGKGLRWLEEVVFSGLRRCGGEKEPEGEEGGTAADENDGGDIVEGDGNVGGSTGNNDGGGGEKERPGEVEAEVSWSIEVHGGPANENEADDGGAEGEGEGSGGGGGGPMYGPGVYIIRKSLKKNASSLERKEEEKKKDKSCGNGGEEDNEGRESESEDEEKDEEMTTTPITLEFFTYE